MRITLIVFRFTWVCACLYSLAASAQTNVTPPLNEATAPEAVSDTARVVPTLDDVFGQISTRKIGPSNQSTTKRSQTADRGSRSGIDHPLESVADGAGNFAKLEHVDAEHVEVSLTPLDRRLRLKHCDENLIYAWTSVTNTMGNTSITARCDGSTPWKVLVRARVQVFHSIPVLRVPVGKGDILTADLVAQRLLDVSALRSETIRSIDNVLGFRFKRRVAAGREISSSVLAPPIVVARGDHVLISDSNLVLDVQMKGTALSGGEVGRKIQVRSNSSGRVIQTWIKGPGQVVVSP